MKEIVEQKKIIDENKVNMIVSASAGSGKTFVMIERIMKILACRDQNHADLDEMLILTFTNQSANEMSQRLEKKLMEKVDENPELVEQLDLIRVCDISTIHAFCQKMLKKYFYKIALSSDFELISEENQKLMMHKCIDRAVQKFKNVSPQDYEDMLQYFSTTRNDKDIINSVEQINYILENQIDAGEWIKTHSTYLYSKLGKELYEDFFNTQIKTFAGSNKQILATLINEAGSLEKLKINLRKIYDFLDQIRQDQSFEQNRQLLFSFRMPPFSFKEENPFLDKVKYAREKFSKRFKQLKEKFRFCDPDIQESLDARAKNIICSLLNIYEESRKIYESKKKSKNLLDFSDLEHKFLQLLDIEEVRTQISQSYKYIFVDEFQDTNPVQMRILEKLNNSTLMTVGDIKQSIYGFRGSTPKIFQDMISNYSKGEGGVSKTLNCNFRSNKDVLNFANKIFSQLMTKTTCGVDYKSESCFVPQAEYPRSQTPAVQICLTQKTCDKNEAEWSGTYDLTKDDSDFLTNRNLRQEARVVAQKILQLRSQKLYDEKTRSLRETNFSDITILVRSRAGVDTLCEELIACGVPIVASSKQMLCSFPEIVVLIDMIKLLLNPSDEIALVAALSSFFGGLDFEELAQIRIIHNDCASFFDCIKLHSECNDEISSKLKSFYNLFDRFQNIYRFRSLQDAIHYLIFDTGYYEACALKSGGMAKCERLKAFFSLFEENNADNIGWWLEYFESTNGPTAPNFSTGEKDFVGINTIHSSKGLEYPIVILFGCEHDLFSSKSQKLNYNPDLGFAAKYVDDEGLEYNSPQFEFIKTKKHQDELAEELRLLYVAMTRAKNSLVICGISDFDNIEKIYDDEDVFQKKTYLDWILGSLEEETISSIRHQKEKMIEEEENFYSIELFSETEKQESKTFKSPVVSKGSPDIEKELNKYINYKYPNKCSINLCQKNSVSSLAFDQNEYSSRNYSPKTFDKSEHETSSLSANDLGTLYHLVFEKIDFLKHYALQDLNQAIIDILGEEKAELVSVEKIGRIVELLRPYFCGKVFREKEFISKVQQSEIVDGGEDENIIVQGKIDLLILGEKNYIFDYKITKINDANMLIKKYQKQLLLYKLAVQKAINKKIDEVFVVDVNHNRLIKCSNI